VLKYRTKSKEEKKRRRS